MDLVEVGIIASMAPDGIIGVDGKVPWNDPLTLKRFQTLTKGSTVIMDRLAWQGYLGSSSLKKRRSIVITKSKLENTETYESLEDALENCTGLVWIAGQEEVYEDGLKYADFIDLSILSVLRGLEFRGNTYSRFPTLNMEEWRCSYSSSNIDGIVTEHVFLKRR